MRRKNTLADFASRVHYGGPGCWLWMGGLLPDGYGYFKMGGRLLKAHRIAFEWGHGKSAEGFVVRHRCHNPRCVRPSHLEIGTPADNVGDRVEAGRSAIGENNGRSKLTAEQVREIRSAMGVTKSALSRRYGVTTAAIRGILRGKTWRHVA